jgi:hypothetical protein
MMAGGSWSHNGALAILDFLGIQDAPAHEVDVNSLALNWIQWDSALEAAAEYGYAASDEDDAFDWLSARTRPISFDGGVIVVNF